MKSVHALFSTLALSLFLFGTVSCAMDPTIKSPVVSKYKNIASMNTSSPSSWGPLNCHDPKLFRDDDGTWYVFSTDASIGNVWGGGIQVRSSSDLKTWTCRSVSALQGNWDDELLEWCFGTGKPSSWAPTVIKKDGKYFMYHGIITDNDPVPGEANKKPRAWIGLAIADSPVGPYKPAHEYDPAAYQSSTIVRYAWEADDEIDSACLNEGNSSWDYGFGAIDPEFVFDEKGNLATDENGDWYMTYGSWKGGIALMRIDSDTGLPADSQGAALSGPADEISGAYGIQIAGGSGSPFEGAQLLYNSAAGYYYLFASSGDLVVDYSVRVGRSASIEGPYLDASGRSMSGVTWIKNDSHYRLAGSKILGSHKFGASYGWRAPGGQSILPLADGRIFFAHHTRTDFLASYFFFLQVRQMWFTSDGWPVLNPNEYYDEILESVDASRVVGSWKAVATERSHDTGNFTTFEGSARSNVFLSDAVATASKSLVLEEGGIVSGYWSGTWSLEGTEVVLDLVSPAESSGTFRGIVTDSVDWNRNKTLDECRTLSIAAICSASGQSLSGEYLSAVKD